MWQPGWGDLPESHRRLRSHVPPCCSYIKIAIETGCAGRLRTCSPRVNSAPLHRLSYWTMTGTGPWTRTAGLSLIRGMLCSLSWTGINWRGRLGSNQGHPDSESGVLPLNYAPSVGASRSIRTNLSGFSGRRFHQTSYGSMVPRASIRTRVLLLTRQALFRLSYAGRGRRGRIRTCISLIKSQDLSPLSYAPCGCSRRSRDSNPRSSARQAGTLASELQCRAELVPPEGFEPSSRGPWPRALVPLN